MRRKTVGAVTLFALVLVASAAVGRGQEASESEGKSGGGSASRGGSASGSDSAWERFWGILASYEVAQSEIDEEGGEQEVGEYRVGYIVEPAEGWWEGPPGNLTWRGPQPWRPTT